MSTTSDAYDELVGILSSAGFRVAVDTPGIAPPCVVVEGGPTSTVAAGLLEVEWRVSFLVAPPGNARARRWLLDAVDTFGALVPFTSGAETIYSTGAQELPAYQVTVTQTLRR